MTDETKTTDQPADDAEGQEPDESSEQQEPDDEQAENNEESTEDNDGESEEGDEDKESSLSPDDALKAVSKLRKENAKWRKQFRDLEKQMAEAVTPEKIAELQADMAAQSRSLLVENVALKYDLPDELAARLTGATREELEADAKSLQKFVTKVTKSADNLSGGLDPTDEDGEFDPVAIAQAHRKRRGNN